MMLTLTAIFWTRGAKVPWHFCSREWKYYVTFIPQTKFQRANPGSKSSIYRTFAPV